MGKHVDITLIIALFCICSAASKYIICADADRISTLKRLRDQTSRIDNHVFGENLPHAQVDSAASLKIAMHNDAINRTYNTYQNKKIAPILNALTNALTVSVLVDIVMGYTECPPLDLGDYMTFMMKTLPPPSTFKEVEAFAQQHPYAINELTIDTKNRDGNTLLHLVLKNELAESNYMHAQAVLALNPNPALTNLGEQDVFSMLNEHKKSHLLLARNSAKTLEEKLKQYKPLPPLTRELKALTLAQGKH